MEIILCISLSAHNLYHICPNLEGGLNPTSTTQVTAGHTLTYVTMGYSLPTPYSTNLLTQFAFLLWHHKTEISSSCDIKNKQKSSHLSN